DLVVRGDFDLLGEVAIDDAFGGVRQVAEGGDEAGDHPEGDEGGQDQRGERDGDQQLLRLQHHGAAGGGIEADVDAGPGDHRRRHVDVGDALDDQVLDLLRFAQHGG